MPEKTAIYLTPNQLKKAMKQKTFQVTSSQLNNPPNVTISLSKTDLNRLNKNQGKGKGFRFQANEFELLDQTEDEIEGGSLKKLFRRASRAVKKAARPLVKEVRKEIRREVNQIGDHLKEKGKDALKTGVRTVTKYGLEAGKTALNKIAPGRGDSIDVDRIANVAGKFTDKKISGLGLKKGSQEAKDRMAALRAMRGAKKITGGTVHAATKKQTNNINLDVIGAGEDMLLGRVKNIKSGGSFLPY